MRSGSRSARRQFLRHSATGVAALALGRSLQAAVAPEAATVMTASGAVRGARDGIVHRYLGIPYGASTAGASRWLPPAAPAGWGGTRDCLEYGSMCPQNVMATVPEELAVLQKGPMGEDCLRVHVWTRAPREPKARLPVMVWLHGGGYAGGSGGASSFDGTRLAGRHGVVVVTVTHRLGVFGFLPLAERFGDAYAASANVGLLDCVAALRWVRDNIAQFGGDAGNVTLFGQSAGAGKICALLSMREAHGLFHRAILQSGSLVSGGDAAAAKNRAGALLNALSASDLPTLQQVSATALVQAGMAQGFQGVSPIVDGTVLTAEPFDPAAPAFSADVPLLIGSNADEATFFAGTPVANTPLEPIDEATLRALIKKTMRLEGAPAEELIGVFRREYPQADPMRLYQSLATQWVFTDGVTQIAERKSDQAAGVFMYLFNRQTPVEQGRLHSTHTLEIGYVFDNLRGSPIVGPASQSSQGIADAMSAAWVRFAQRGDPNHGSLHWPRYERGHRRVLAIGDQLSVIEDPHRATREAIAALKRPGG